MCIILNVDKLTNLVFTAFKRVEYVEYMQVIYVLFAIPQIKHHSYRMHLLIDSFLQQINDSSDDSLALRLTLDYLKLNLF